jgi:hypothetical protein
MESKKINLRLPLNARVILERPNTDRAASRTSHLADSSFSSDVPQEGGSPRIVSSSSYKTLSAVGKLKDMLQKTSDKLRVISNRSSTPKLPHNDPGEKTNELGRLKREIKILEMEK